MADISSVSASKGLRSSAIGDFGVEMLDEAEG
jgi:hypothetical protein